jgi:NADH-quinone oxidoreductase subunit G
VLAELGERIGHPLGVLTGAEATAQLAEAVPFYAGVTRDEIGGRGVNWQAREAASALPEAEAGPFDLERPPAAPSPNGALRLGTFRSIWASKEVEASPALKFLAPEQRVQLSPEDAQRLGVGDGDLVEVVHERVTVRGIAQVHAAVPAGTALLEVGTVVDSANALTNGEPRLVEVHRQ